MKVVHLATHDVKSGAARSLYRLHGGLRQRGMDSRMFVLKKASRDDSVVVFRPPVDVISRVRRRLRRRRLRADLAPYVSSRPAGVGPFSDLRTPYRRSVVDQLPGCDVVNLHWVARFVDIESFFTLLPASMPVVWRLSDMNPLTGGCHYDEGCGRYLSGCGACPQLGSSDPTDISHEVWQRKKALFEPMDPSRLHFIAQSQWMAGEVRRHPFFRRFPVTVIPNAIDVVAFAPRDRRLAREVLGIDADAKVVLFVAFDATERRKGFALLKDAVVGLEGDGICVLSVGHGEVTLDSAAEHRHLGPVGNERFLSLIYSAADVFVITSLQDNLPNTVLESLACGTPIVGFEVGGIPDMVRPGVTGQLAPAGDVRAFRAAVRQILDDEVRRAQMSDACRRIAVEEYSLEVQAGRFADLYVEKAQIREASLSSSRQ